MMNHSQLIPFFMNKIMLQIPEVMDLGHLTQMKIPMRKAIT